VAQARKVFDEDRKKSNTALKAGAIASASIGVLAIVPLVTATIGMMAGVGMSATATLFAIGGAVASIPVAGWVAAAVLVVAATITALVMLNRKVEIVEHICETQQQCSDVTM
jgi:uncharacterized membrane protein